MFPNGPDARPAMDEDERVLCLLAYIYMVCDDEVGSEQGEGSVLIRSKLTDFNGCHLVLGSVYGRTAGGFVFPVERKLGNCGSCGKDDGEDRQQHVKGRMVLQPIAMPVI